MEQGIYIQCYIFFKIQFRKKNCICRFEKYKYNGNLMYVVVGYMIIYNYYVYLEKVRFRVRYIVQLEFFVLLRMDVDLNSICFQV